jgi:hypothetical protein
VETPRDTTEDAGVVKGNVSNTAEEGRDNDEAINAGGADGTDRGEDADTRA